MMLKHYASVISQKNWRKLSVFFLIYLLPVLLFVAIAEEVRENETLGFDVAILESVHSLATPARDAAVRALTDLGYTWWVGGMTVILLIVLLYMKKRYQALVVAFGVGGSVVINLLLKALFQRDRPQLWERLVVENSHSFPSGHAMASASLAVVIIVLLWPTKWRWLALAGGAVYMLLIAFTRLYLGVHYPTDIIAGWAVTTAWVLIVAAVLRPRQYAKKL